MIDHHRLVLVQTALFGAAWGQPRRIRDDHSTLATLWHKFGLSQSQPFFADGQSVSVIKPTWKSLSTYPLELQSIAWLSRIRIHPRMGLLSRDDTLIHHPCWSRKTRTSLAIVVKCKSALYIFRRFEWTIHPGTLIKHPDASTALYR